MRRELRHEMLWHDYAPSSVAEQILARELDRVILPAPLSARRDLEGLRWHMHANGVGQHFSAREIAAPHQRQKASECGYTQLVPPGHTWGVVCLLVWIADQMREAAAGPVTMRNLWRPQSYNTLVASSGIESDHPNACGMDLDFGTPERREAALEWLVGWLGRTSNAARLSVGLGGSTLHIGVLSPRGSRYWRYDSYPGDVPAAIVMHCRD